MKIVNATLSAFVASSLIAAPIAARAAEAVTARSDSAVRVQRLGGWSWGWIFAVLVVIGVIAIIASDSDETLPHSP